MAKLWAITFAWEGGICFVWIESDLKAYEFVYNILGFIFSFKIKMLGLQIVGIEKSFHQIGRGDHK